MLQAFKNKGLAYAWDKMGKHDPTLQPPPHIGNIYKWDIYTTTLSIYIFILMFLYRLYYLFIFIYARNRPICPILPEIPYAP